MRGHSGRANGKELLQRVGGLTTRSSRLLPRLASVAAAELGAVMPPEDRMSLWRQKGKSERRRECHCE